MQVEQAEQLAKALLANNVIQHWTIGEIKPTFPEEAESSGAVELILVRDLTDDELLSLSKERHAALDLAEMQVIKSYFTREGRDLTDYNSIL